MRTTFGGEHSERRHLCEQAGVTEDIAPYSDKFVPALESYCEQIRAAVSKGAHHDQRRHLFVNFLREGFGIAVDEIELEHKIKANSVRGRIDAFYRFLIIEFKTDLDRERDDAKRELKKYFESQAHSTDYLGLVTDGVSFEVYVYGSGEVRQISAFELEPTSPLVAFRHLDQILFTSKHLIPTSPDIVMRFGQCSTVFNASSRLLAELYVSVKDEPSMKVKFREWNSLLAKVYGSPLGDERLFIKHTYLTMLSRVIVTSAIFPTARRTLRQFRGIVDGEFFSSQNVKNLAEPDFFSWALDTKVETAFLEFLANLFRYLDIYDFEKLEEDILKELYQALVDPESRHDLGEYYTPDWLAYLTLEKIGYKKGRLLDPASGSGSLCRR